MPIRRQISGLTIHLGYWLRLVSNHVSQAFARKVENEGVTVAEWVFLRALFAQEDVSPSQLSETLGMTRGAISKLSDRLLAKKLLIRSAHEQDGRAHTLALTRKGRELVPVLAALADANDEEFFADLSRSERTTLMGFLQRIAAAKDLRDTPVD
jgi:MarR family transcriptional regulator, lower aerobic nicotinate degradation pathway regulator